MDSFFFYRTQRLLHHCWQPLFKQWSKHQNISLYQEIVRNQNVYNLIHLPRLIIYSNRQKFLSSNIYNPYKMTNIA